MVDYAQFQTGASSYPLTTSTTNSLLKDADPALFYVIDFFASVITTYVGPRLLAEAANAPAIAGITSAVMQVLPMDPGELLQEQQLKFPLLAVYRQKDVYQWKSASWNDDASTWRVVYVLPPLTGGQRERVLPALRAVAKTLQNRIENQQDPAYQSGASPWALANLESIELVSGEYGAFAGTGNLRFPAWTGTLMVKERDIEAANQWTNTFTGIDAEIDLVTPNYPPVADVADFALTFVDPTTIPTLVSFHRADAGITAGTDASRVGAWSDQSASGITLSAGGPSNQPILVKSGVTLPSGTTKPVIRFDGSSSYVTGTATALGVDTGKTYVVLFRLYDTGFRSSIVLQSGGSANTTLSIEASVNGKLGLAATGSLLDSVEPSDAAWRIAVVRVSSTAAGGTVTTTTNFQVDGQSKPLTVTSGAGTWSTLVGATSLIVGGLPSALATTAAHCDVGVVMTFSSALSDSDAAKAVTYCRQWAGLPLP